MPSLDLLSPSGRRRLRALVAATGTLEERVRGMSDTELAGTHAELSAEHRRGRPLADLAPEVFARTREAARRVLGMRPYDVQVMAAGAIAGGRVAEVRTGEGKTLTSTMPLVLHSLAHPNVHAVTANPYLAARDAELMGPLYAALGLRVGVARPEDAGLVAARREAYAADITYGTASEFGFDYLRDNLAHSRARQVQCGHGFCLIDEVDSVLIDEARTPLIISGPADDHSETYRRFAALVATLRQGLDYEVDEALRVVTPLEGALGAAEEMLGEDLHRPEGTAAVNQLVQALRARALQQRDRHYLVRDGQVVLIDELTGRTAEGRQWADGLYQAVQAKEGLAITPESVTLASISVQNYFRLYRSLGGASGTARSDRDELLETYGMEVEVIPTHRPVARVDEPDLIFRGQAERLAAVVAETARRHRAGQPVLLGTPSVAMSEQVSAAFTKAAITHRVLNAKDPEAEAGIIAVAGRRGAVTIATNMAGRGVDIALGEGVVELGGLCVIGTARHDSRRIDDQLRGRAGRQGDLGCSRFFIAADDELVRLFGGERVGALMAHLPGDPASPVELPQIARAVVRAQRSVERRDAEGRRRLLEYDQVLHRQRLAWFAERQRLVEGVDLAGAVGGWITAAGGEGSLSERASDQGAQGAPAAVWSARREAHPALFGAVERLVALEICDRHWRAHLEAMTALRDGIELRAIAGEDPVVAYALEGGEVFGAMQRRARAEIARTLLGTSLAEPFSRPASPASSPAGEGPA